MNPSVHGGAAVLFVDIRPVDAIVFHHGLLGPATRKASFAFLDRRLFLILYISMILLSNRMLKQHPGGEGEPGHRDDPDDPESNPTTLILGKIISLFAVGLVQMAVFLASVLVGCLSKQQHGRDLSRAAGTSAADHSGGRP